MGFEILAGPVNNQEVAAELERAGATAVIVMPDPLPRFGSDAAVNLGTVKAIRDKLKSAKLCLLLDGAQGGSQLQDYVARLRPEYIAFDVRRNVADGLAQIVRAAKAEVLLVGSALDYDEDPGWAELRIQALHSEWSPASIVLTLLPGLKNPVHWLRDESGRFEEDVRIADIERLLARHSLIVNMEMGEHDIDWACERLGAASGVAFFVGKAKDDGGCPVISDPGRVAALIRRVIGAGGSTRPGVNEEPE